MVKTFETYLTSEEKENYKRLEQNINESKTKMSKGSKQTHGTSTEAIPLIENITDDNYVKLQSIKPKQEIIEIHGFSDWFNY